MMFNRRARSQHDEQGAILVLTVAVIGVSLLFASLAIDVGGARVVRRDMQSVADVIALDLARNLDGRAANGYADWNDPTKLFSSARTTSLGRQKGLFASPDSVKVWLATANPQTGAFIGLATSGDIPNAVKVQAAGSWAFRLTPVGTTVAPAHPQRTALAVIGPPMVCITAGSTLADLTPGGTLDVFLGKLIGLNQLSAVSPGGVASLDAQIPLGQLATQLNVGSVDQVASANVTGKSFLIAAATVLSNNGNNAAANVLNAIAARVSGTALNVSQILNLNTGAGSAADLKLDAFSLAQAVIEVSNKNNFVDLTVPAGITGLASIVLKAKIIEAPRIACGPKGTKATSSQVQISLTADVLDALGLVTSIKIGPLLLSAGSGAGTIASLTCSPSGSTLGVSADTAVGQLKLTLAVKLLLGLVSIPVEVPDSHVKPDGAAIGSSSSVPLTFTIPTGASSWVPDRQTAGTGMGNLGLASISPVSAAGISTGLLSSVLGLVDGLVSPLLNAVLTSLGIRLGTVEIKPVTRPACSEPQLRG